MRRYNPTEDEGVNALGRIFNRKFGWIFREQLKADMGIDAQVEICEDGKPLGRLIALQIKSGKSWFEEGTTEGFVFRGSPIHLEYWLQHSLPVILVLYNPETEQAYWQVIVEKTVIRTGKDWKTIVPIAHNLNDGLANQLKKYATESPAIQQLRRVLLMRNDILLEEKILSTLLQLQKTLNKQTNIPQTRLSELNGHQVLALKICLRLKEMGLPAIRISVIYDFLIKDDLITHIVRMVLLGYHTYLIFSTDNKAAIWSAKDLADYLFLGAEERDQAEVLICLNKFVNDIWQAQGLSRREISWHPFTTYEEYIKEIKWVWQEMQNDQQNYSQDPTDGAINNTQ